MWGYPIVCKGMKRVWYIVRMWYNIFVPSSRRLGFAWRLSSNKKGDNNKKRGIMQSQTRPFIFRNQATRGPSLSKSDSEVLENIDIERRFE